MKQKERSNKFVVSRAKSHANNLISTLNIKVVGEGIYLDWNSAWADPEKLEIAIPKIKTLEDYLAVLHEIGHCFLKHTWKTWDDEARCEIEAWDYVYKNSLFEVPQELKDKHYMNRLKGSWETEKREDNNNNNNNNNNNDEPKIQLPDDVWLKIEKLYRDLEDQDPVVRQRAEEKKAKILEITGYTPK
jgi:hypothetical protein